MVESTLLVGFDSAWTPGNSGALVGVLRDASGSYRELGEPWVVTYAQAHQVIEAWQDEYQPSSTMILLDQSTIVPNAQGQRPVENLVASPVSRRYGGVQPSYTSRVEMFGEDAPVWAFLRTFGGASDPLGSATHTSVYETYPVLTFIALGWILEDQFRPTGRLPKYNPERPNFSTQDWQFVCRQVSTKLIEFRIPQLSGWIASLAEKVNPKKNDQDSLDACICLLVALFLAEEHECMMVGNTETGYMVVPAGEILREELVARCITTSRNSDDWVRVFRRSARSEKQ